MRRAIVSTKEGVSHPVDDTALIDAKKAPEKVLWLDIQKPAEEDFRMLLDGFGFHPLSVDDLRTTHGTAKLDEYDDYVFQVVMVPAGMTTEEVKLLEVEMFYMKGTLVTCHDEPWPALDELWDRVCHNPRFELGRGAQTLYHNLVDRGVDAYFPILDAVDERVEGIEREVFDIAQGRQTLPDLFRLRRNVRQLLRSARNQRESVQRLAAGTVRSLTKETCYLFRDVHDHLLLIHDTLDDHRETLGGLRDTYLGVISNRMNEVMKTLTIFSALLLPLAFLTGIWGMNFDVLPGKNEPYGFWVFLGACVVVSLVMLRFMWRKGWLKRIT